MRTNSVGRYVDHPFRRAAGEVHRADELPGQRLFVLFGSDADHEIAADDATAHVTRGEKRESAEHLLFGNVRAVGQECADPFGERFVVSHPRDSAIVPFAGPGRSTYIERVALVVFLRGVNVGGHKTFRPSLLAKELSDYDVVNVGAAGTFVVRKPGSRTAFREALRRKLPFDADIALCDGRDLMRLEKENPFAAEPSRPDVVRFVSVLTKAGTVRLALPIALPPEGEWLVRVIETRGQFIFGVYRRHMKTIGYLSQMDKLFAGRATTRNWNTIDAILRILKGREKEG